KVEQAFFGTTIAGHAVVLRESHCPEQHGVGAVECFARFVRKRRKALVERTAAEEHLDDFELFACALARELEHADALRTHLGADAVTWKGDDAERAFRCRARHWRPSWFSSGARPVT